MNPLRKPIPPQGQIYHPPKAALQHSANHGKGAATIISVNRKANAQSQGSLQLQSLISSNYPSTRRASFGVSSLPILSSKRSILCLVLIFSNTIYIFFLPQTAYVNDAYQIPLIFLTGDSH
jgi:hypothetical protein